MAMKANAQGVLSGQFQIPANVPAGVKNVEFTGAGGSHGAASFTGQGTILTQVLRTVTTITTNFYDPLAQTFSLPEPTPVGGVDLWFTAKGSEPVQVQIRGVTNGVPNRTIHTEATIAATAINLVGSTRITFDAPVWVEGNTEYALVVLTDDAATALSIAELGKWDNYTSKWVTAQPYQVGVLLSSSNASTWTPHQDKDLSFRLLKANYSQSERTVALGTVPVTAATDLLLLPLADMPTFNSRIEYKLTLPGGTVLTVDDGQPVRLPTATTGNIAVSAKLTGTPAASPVLFPGIQLAAGAVATTADYVTVGIPAGTNSRVRVIMDVTLPPGGAGVAVKVSGVDAGDTYQNVPFLSSSPLSLSKQEVIYELSGVNEQMIKVKLELTGTSVSRPIVENLRVIVL